MAKHRHEPGPPMTLGNMRELRLHDLERFGQHDRLTMPG